MLLTISMSAETNDIIRCDVYFLRQINRLRFALPKYEYGYNGYYKTQGWCLFKTKGLCDAYQRYQRIANTKNAVDCLWLGRYGGNDGSRAEEPDSIHL